MKRTGSVLIFILITYGFSWAFWVPDALIAQGIMEVPDGFSRVLALNLGAWGPLIGALVTTYIFQKGTGVKLLLKRGVKVHLGKWWLVILLMFPVLIGGALIVASVLGSPLPEFSAFGQPIVLVVGFFFIFFLGGPLQEEFGWRGYAFEHLKQRHSGLIAAIIAGGMWGLWHLPLFYIPRQEAYYNRPIWGLLLTTILVGIILAWFYQNTKGSVFAVMLGHTMFNWSNWALPALESDTAALVLFGLYFMTIGFIVWRYGRSLAGTDKATQNTSTNTPNP